MAGQDGPELPVNDVFAGLDRPRIRQITGVRIHQLTLPQSLSLASKLIPDVQSELPDVLGESSQRSSSPARIEPSSSRTPLKRTATSSSHRRQPAESPNITRQRSTSSATLTYSPSSSPIQSPALLQPRIRTTRPRAPTLAGEAIEHALAGSHSVDNIVEEGAENVEAPRHLARCFITLTIPTDSRSDQSGSSRQDGPRPKTKGYDITGLEGEIPFPRKANGKTGLSEGSYTKRQSSIPSRPARTPSSGSTTTPSPKNRIRPSLSSSSARSSYTQTTSPPSSGSSTPKTPPTSLQSHPNGKSGEGREQVGTTDGHANPDRPAISRSGSSRASSRMPGQNVGLGIANGFAGGALRRSVSGQNGRSQKLDSTKTSPTITLTKSVPDAPTAPISTPFYVSPIHPPTTYPRFLSLSPQTDFAPWMTVEQGASSQLVMEVWTEYPPSDSEAPLEDSVFTVQKVQEPRMVWRKVEGLGGLLDLGDLRRVSTKSILPPNTIQFSISSDPESLFYLPTGNGHHDHDNVEIRQSVLGVVERSIRETRMKKGVGVGALHQLVNIQAVIADTKRGIAEVRRKIEILLSKDADHRRIKRDINEREAKVGWIKEKISEVEQTTKEARARITLEDSEICRRRKCLHNAMLNDRVLEGKVNEVSEEIQNTESARNALLPTIHRLRALHVQTLDALFPITPLNPSTLLFSILDVPLPIPVGPKDPAPPLSLPNSAIPGEGRSKIDKVDERSTATALGYVAMVLQVLGGLVGWGGVGGAGGGGGLPYPVTCAGSRSLVRDVVSVMQGPRSFPLYAKGVERYRFEYAVFLLNKNIELLMHDSNIRLLDMRHTLPNLKNLLLTLSSPDLPAAPRQAITSGSNTQPSSRQVSRVWSRAMTPLHTGSESIAVTSPGSSIDGRSRDRESAGFGDRGSLGLKKGPILPLKERSERVSAGRNRSGHEPEEGMELAMKEKAGEARTNDERPAYT